MKIAINGIGIGGPALAWWLKRHGFEPVLFEKAPALRRGGYVIDLWGIGYHIATRMGLADHLQTVGYSVKELRLVDENGAPRATYKLSQLNRILNGQYVSIRRSDLSAALFGACEDLGIEAHFGTAITGLEERGSTVVTTLSDGTQRHFDLVIGADGLHSAIREMTFGPEERFEKQLGACVAAFTLSGYQRRDALTYLTHQAPGRAISRMSLRNDRTLALMTMRSSLLGNLSRDPARQKAQVKEAFADMGWETPALLDGLDSAEDFYFDQVSQIRMPRWHRGRVALIGDAAACASLLAGEGTGLAMAEAYVLAGELARAGGDHEIALAAMEARLRDFLAAKQKAALRSLPYFAPKNRFQMTMSALAIRGASLPFLSGLFIGTMIRDEIDLPDYLQED